MDTTTNWENAFRRQLRLAATPALISSMDTFDAIGAQASASPFGISA